MITNLEEFYNKVQNPILDESNFNSLVEAYASHNFLDSNYQGDVGNVYATESDVFNPDDFDKFYVKVFNYWKKHLTTREISNTSPLYSLQQYFRNISDATTWKDAVAAFPHKMKTEYLNKFLDVTKDCQRINSVKIHEDDGNIHTTPFDVEHVLYVNVDLKNLHKFASKFLDKCEDKDLPYLFEIRTRFSNDKSVAISSDSKHLVQYYQILQEIIKEDKDLKKHIYHPPVFSGIIDGWIGYESAEMAKSKDNEKTTHHILSKGFKKMVASQPDVPITTEEEDVALIDLVTSNIVDKEVNYLSKLSRTQLKDHFGLKPRDLNNRKFLKTMYDEVNNELKTGIQNNSFKFNDVNIYFRKNKKFFSIPNNDLEKALSATLKDITIKYPNIKKKLQSSILKLADQKGFDTEKFCMKKKDRMLFKNTISKIKEKMKNFSPFDKPSKTNTTNNKDENIDAFTYHLRKEQIIQDLPINSKEESRYSGIMSEQEIKESQEKIKTFIKK